MSERRDNNGLGWWLIAIGTIIIIWMAALGSGQCLEFTPPLMFDTSDNTSAHPLNPRIHGLSQMQRGDDRYLIGNIGNRMALWKITDPAHPGSENRSIWMVMPTGDRDYSLFNFSVCDNCRYGVVGAEAFGTVIWDFGVGPTPTFSSYNHLVSWGNIGGFTYSSGGDQYLVLNNHPNGCTGNKAGVFSIDGITTGDQTLNQCLESSSGGGFVVYGGLQLGDYVYIVDANMVVRIYHINGSQLDYHSEPLYAFWLHGRGIRVDGDRLVTSSPMGTWVYDVSDPANPVELATMTMPIGYANVAGISDSGILTASKGTGTGIWFWKNGSIIDQSFWDISHPWNSYPRSSNWDVEMVGEWMYLARFSVLEKIHVCNDLIFADGFETGDTSKWGETK